jgi:purine-binding chemotaxis protein CheW
MSDRQYLIFSLHGLLYGIDAALVREVTYLPELHSIATAPKDIIGMVDWRSQLVPVMHLDLRFGKQFSGCKIEDRLMVFQSTSTPIGIVAEAVYEVQTLQVENTSIDLFQGRGAQAEQTFMTGIARLKDTPVICLDLDRLIRAPEVANLDIVGDINSDLGGDFYRRCFPTASFKEIEILRQRAEKLKSTTTETRANETVGIIPVQIGDEYLGFPLEFVIDVDRLDRSQITPVPKAPSHIMGQINWRGEILPIVELAGIFRQSAPSDQEVVVVQVKDMMMGMAVSEILDVLDLPLTQIESIPKTVETSHSRFLEGVTKYDDRLIYLVQLPELVEQLTINN